MNLTSRDRKIAMVLLPLVLVLGYWFMVLGPKRKDAASLGTRLTQIEGKRDKAVAQLTELEGSKSSYAKDYEAVVRLGKAIPATLDMPSLIVQLDDAAKGTGIRFKKVRAGERNETPPAPPAPAAKAGSGGDAAAGGDKASTGAGKATEQANNTAAGANAAAGGKAAAAPGLDNIPLEFSFTGSFFDLADFFHKMKRFVRVANEDIKVNGRLLTIDGLTFQAAAFPIVKAEVRATVYLSPKSEGTTAGATSQGPATTQASSGSSTAPAPAPSGAKTPVAQSGDDAR